MNRNVVVISQEEMDNKITLSEQMEEVDKHLHFFNTDLANIDSLKYAMERALVHIAIGETMDKEEQKELAKHLDLFEVIKTDLLKHSRDAQFVINNIRKLLDGKTIE